MGTLAILDRRDVWSAGMATLAHRCGFQVVGHWSDLATALPMLRKDPPNLLILSWGLVQLSSKEHLAVLHDRLSIIILIEPEARLDADDLKDCPFAGLLFSDASASSVESCIRAVATGHSWIDPAFLRPRREGDQRDSDWSHLSHREVEVARLAAQGLSNKGIAQRLCVSEGTVKMHMHHILAKLHLERRADLAFLELGGSRPMRSRLRVFGRLPRPTDHKGSVGGELPEQEELRTLQSIDTCSA